MDSQTITNQGGVGLQVNIGQVFGSIQQPAELPTPFQAPPLPPDPLLVGREGLLRKLKGLLVAHGSVALDGLPGAGKTSLAVSLANDMALYPKEFPDGVLWVGLGRHPAELDRLAYWGRSLGLPAPGMSKPSSVTEWAELIHAVVGSRRMLLVVDDAWDSRIALAFRLGGPECGHLLTTRRYEVATAFAGTAGELPVHELADDEAGELLSRLAPSAMREHPEAMHKLVGQMGGLPLAVNLLGRYLESQSRAGMGQEAVGELRDVHRRLEVGAEQSALDHHPDIDPDVSLSLLAIIGVSDDALDEAGKRALRSLAAFPAKPSTFSKTAATAVADAPAAVIASLVQAGLVERVGDRFTIHQTIADYARVESSDPAAGGRMADFFTQG